jgi:DNA-binding protein
MSDNFRRNSDNNRHFSDHDNFRDRRGPPSQNVKEKTIIITNEEDTNKKEEYIGNILFDIMFGITQDKIEKIILRSQGPAINVCADLIIALEKRLKDQLIPIKKRISLNSKSFDNRNDRDRQNPHQNRMDMPQPQILSFMDATYTFNKDSF